MTENNARPGNVQARRAAAYIRVSTSEQTEYSPASQRELIGRYADRCGIEIAEEHVYLDEGISGRSADKRPAFLRMISDAKKKPRPFDVILVYSLSRFARSREDSVVYKRILRRELGIDIISVSQELGGDKTSILVEALLEAMDEYYSVDLGENVKRGMYERAKRGEAVTAAPIGYVIKEGKYLPDPGSAAVVRSIFTDFAAGKTCREIAVKLNADGVRTARGGRFESRSVSYILNNPVYVGKLRWTPGSGGETLTADGVHEGIIDPALWEATRPAAARRLTRERSGEPYMLKGLVKCSSCGGTMILTGGGWLQCHRYAKGLCTVSHSVGNDALERVVLEAVRRDLGVGEIRCPSGPTDDRPGELEEACARVRRRLERAKEAYESGVDTLAEYSETKRRLACELERLEGELERVTPDGGETPSAFRGTADYLTSTSDEGDKNRLLRALVGRIVFDRAESTVEIHYLT